MRQKRARLAPRPKREKKVVRSVRHLQLVHDQLVLDAKCARYGIRAYSGDGLVHRVLDGSVESYMSVIDHDANRVRRIARIAAEHGITINRSCRKRANRIVKPRNRQHTYIIYEILYTGRARDDGEL